MTKVGIQHHWVLHEFEKRVNFIPGLSDASHGVHLVVVHSGYINKSDSPAGFRGIYDFICGQLLNSLVIDPREVLSDSDILKGSGDQLMFLDFDLAASVQEVIAFFSLLREKVFDADTFLRRSLIIVVPFWVWDILHDRRVLSVVDYHKYLCWDDNKLLAKGEKEGSDEEFFQGAGFHAVTERDRYPMLDQYDLGELNNVYERTFQRLGKQNDRLHALGQGGQINLSPPKLGYHYLHVLANFLPPFRWEQGGKNHWIPSNAGNWGGPVKWQSIWALDMHTRHLLLDGWLSLWNDHKSGGLLLQPASLSLMYWVARYTDRPHTESISAFLDNYDWSRSRWFGGRWHRGG